VSPSREATAAPSGAATARTAAPTASAAPVRTAPTDPIPRPILGPAPRRDRLRAALLFAAARAIEFSFGVLNTVAFPVQRVRASRLPPQGPIIFVANHRSLLDTPFIRWSFERSLRQRLVPVGGFDFFEPRGSLLKRLLASLVLRFIVDGYRVWMIDRRLDGNVHLGPLAALIDSGWSLLLYPEGRRSRTGRMGAMQPGAALLARRFGAAVVPIFIDGTQRILPPGSTWPRPGALHIRVGAPLRPEPLEHPEAFMRRLRAALSSLSRGAEAPA